MKDLNKKESSIRRMVKNCPPNLRLADLNERLPGEHGLNQQLSIPFMEAKGAYHILAKILGMIHIDKGLFIEEETGRKYILTKYGFKTSVSYNYQVKYAEMINELRAERREKGDLKKILYKIKEQRQKELANSRDKKHNQATTLKDFQKKIIEQKGIIHLQKQKIVELRRELKE